MSEPAVADNFIQTNHCCPFCGEYQYPNLLHLCKGADTLVFEDMGNVGISDGMLMPGEPLDIYSPSAGVEVKMSNTKAELEALKKMLGDNCSNTFARIESIKAGLAFASLSDPLRVREYHLPVIGEAADWYFASRHTPPSHYGLDINLRQSPRGDVELGFPILATCAGLVVFAQQARGKSWGNLIATMSLDDDGPIYWRYGHCQDVMVKRGDFVRVGQQIGTIGKGYNDRYFAHLDIGAARNLQGPGEWGSYDVSWLDPLVAWQVAGYSFDWGQA